MRFIAFCIALTLLMFSFRTGMGVSFSELGDLQDLSTQQDQQPANQGEALNDLSENNNLAEEELFVALLRPPHLVLQQELSSVCDFLLLNHSTELDIHTPPPKA